MTRWQGRAGGGPPAGSALAVLLERLRADADRCASQGALVSGEAVYRQVADDLEDAFTTWWEEPLDVVKAAAECGYSEDHLRQLCRQARLRHARGGRHFSIRRCDLPRHPTPPVSAALLTLADRGMTGKHKEVLT